MRIGKKSCKLVATRGCCPRRSPIECGGQHECEAQHGVGFQYAAQYPDEVARYAHLDYSLPGPGLSADELRTYSWHLAFHEQEEIPEAVVSDDVREYLALFYPQVAFGGASFGGTRTESPFTDAQIDEFARTYRRPQVLTGGSSCTARWTRTSATTPPRRRSACGRCS